MFEIKNELGQISFSKNIIYKICYDAADRLDGAARIQNYKGRYTTKKPGLLTAFNSSEEDTDDIEMLDTEQGLVLTLYIVVKFGVSMSTTANAIIDYIYEQMEAVFGVPPAFVKVIVTGTASKTIAKRHIEFNR